jgi:tetratricopeptide (TPR) repeat protein
MSPSAIFFGGTDPGRFVPTYMIYSANFRPDIYLITQNALADETYMQVERDLYGDEIWIPAKEDSSDAFGIYIDEVHRGVRRANGDLKIENERVQVTGALGVMEINGILTEMMWRHDRLRHDFYVEESYAIKWMYPYLSPHGLIMKLNRDKTPYDAARAAKDCDFWDWYTRRLLKDPMFRRDFAGQKSFSKLRAALAGLYASQGRRAEAAQAFRESVLLYPASPEAVFRYAQSSLLTARRWDIALELMDYTDAIDPNNTRTARVREAVGYLRSLFGIADKIEDQRRRGQALSRQDTFTLGHAYFNIGSVYKGLNFDDGLGYVMRAAQVVRTLVDAIADPRALKSIAEILVEAELNADAEKCLTKLTTLRPDDGAEPWLQLAKLQYKSDRKQAARRSFEAALALDRGKVLESIQKDQLVYEIAVMSRARPRR